jgi:hypothetical protein
MRSNMITVAAVVAGIFLAAPMATADDVQEQLRLMEQRMAEMEDRLQATSDELNTAKSTVQEQQNLLTDAGLTEDERGIRSGVGNFMKEVDVSGVVAASYNYRFLDSGDDQSAGGNTGYFRHPDSNTFALDQLWLTVDKAVTEESRAGFHADYVHGKTAGQQFGGIGFDESGLLYSGYVSYLAPIGNGVQIDAGKLGTVLGAETIKANDNFNITQGLVFGLQPVAYVGFHATTALTDNLSLTVGVVNDVYTANNFDNENDKAYVAQLSLATDMFGLNVGAIVGEDSTSGAGCLDADDDCYTSVLDVVLSADPTDNLSLWANFDWVRTFMGSNKRAPGGPGNGDAYGAAVAGRIGITDDTGFATRVEYVHADSDFNGGLPGEILSLTGTIDHALTDDLKLRLEARWDRILDDNTIAFVNGQNGPSNPGGAFSAREDQVVGLAELMYEF